MDSIEPIENGIIFPGQETAPEAEYRPEEYVIPIPSVEGTMVETEYEAEAEAELGGSEMAAVSETEETDKFENTDPNDNSISIVKKWPGWPGDCVFRLVVPVLKVGSIIGRKGELIKKVCEETRARIRVLDGPLSSPDRIVSIVFALSFFFFLHLYIFVSYFALVYPRAYKIKSNQYFLVTKISISFSLILGFIIKFKFYV